MGVNLYNMPMPGNWMELPATFIEGYFIVCEGVHEGKVARENDEEFRRKMEATVRPPR